MFMTYSVLSLKRRYEKFYHVLSCHAHVLSELRATEEGRESLARVNAEAPYSETTVWDAIQLETQLLLCKCVTLPYLHLACSCASVWPCPLLISRAPVQVCGLALSSSRSWQPSASFCSLWLRHVSDALWSSYQDHGFRAKCCPCPR
jgi:hypothetical protein